MKLFEVTTLPLTPYPVVGTDDPETTSDVFPSKLSLNVFSGYDVIDAVRGVLDALK